MDTITNKTAVTLDVTAPLWMRRRLETLIRLAPVLLVSSICASCLVEAQTIDPLDGLAAHYPLDGHARDESGNENHGAPDGPTPTEDRNGIQGGALQFDGVDDYIRISESPTSDLSRMAKWTMMAWIKPSNLNASAWMMIYSEGFFTVSPGLIADGSLVHWINNSNGLQSDILFPVDQWAHIAVVNDGLLRSIYINGKVALVVVTY